jgi:rRNA biogenesis protein RRP5
LTIKKSLVNSQEEILKSYADAVPGLRTPGTIVALRPNGAIVEFFGGVRGFLPVAEISEAFIQDPKDHFHLGQSVSVRVVLVNPEEERMIVSCRASSGGEGLEKLGLGSLVSASVVEKSKTDAVVDIQPQGIKGILASAHLTDGDDMKVQLKKIKVGEVLNDLVIIDKNLSKRYVTLSSKPSLVSAAKSGSLPCSMSELTVGQKLHGYVKNATDIGVFVGFCGSLTGLALKHELSEAFVTNPRDNFSPGQSVECYVIAIDDSQNRFQLTLKKPMGADFNPVDTSIKSVQEFVPGKVTKAQVLSVKDTQLNVKLADGVQGRVDVSELFEDMDAIADMKHPLKAFSKGQVLPVKIIGYHDARNHRFLPFSHRTSTHIVLELSAKAIANEYIPLTYQETKLGTKWLGFVNNITVDFVWVSLSPTVRGRISLLDLTNNFEELDDVEKHFPIGSAIECTVVEESDESLRLSARTRMVEKLEDLKVGHSLAGLIVKVTDAFALVKLGTDVVAFCNLTDALDDYDQQLKSVFMPHQLVKATVIDVDIANKRAYVSLRESQGPGSKPVDRQITRLDDVHRNDILRACVKNVANGGVFLSLGGAISARVQIKNLSDAFLNDWKKFFQVGQIVKGKVLSVEGGRVEVSLKESDVGESVGPSLSDLQEGDIHEGVVARVEDFGVFVRLADSPISGLCHRSEVADLPVEDLTKVFAVGDKVKVRVLDIDLNKQRLSLGMKASYFGAEADEDVKMDKDVDMEEAEDDDDGVIRFEDSESEDESENEVEQRLATTSSGLSVGFDWTASILDQAKDDAEDESESEDEQRAKKKRKKNKVVEDKTATLTTKLPQSVGDFERLLVGSPNSSILWMNFMAFQLQLSEVDKAREVGQRALKTISFREEQERLNIWIALLNLENNFGTDQTVEDTFKEAVQYMDSTTIHLKLANIYARSNKISNAEQVYDATVKKFGGSEVSLWLVYANFLFDHDKATKARALLDRALKLLPNRDHKDVITKFAQLEYNKGEVERGRTLFEGLLSTYPRRIDLWVVYMDYEIKTKDRAAIERLFERIIGIKLTMKQAKFFFKKWLGYEEKYGDDKSADYVKARAAEYVASRKEVTEDEQ